MKRLIVLIGLMFLLVACTNDPNATIREVEKTETQLTFTVFIEDPSNKIEQFDVFLMDGNTVLTQATNYAEGEPIEGLWDITFPMTTYETGAYAIVVEVTLTNGDTVELVTEAIEWP